MTERAKRSIRGRLKAHRVMGSVTRCELVAHHLEVGFVVVNNEEHWLLHGHRKPIGDPSGLDGRRGFRQTTSIGRDPTASVAGSTTDLRATTPSLGLTER